MSHTPTTTLKSLWAILRAERQEVRSIYIYAIFQGLVSLSLPLGIQAIINFIQAGRLSTSWYVLAAFVLTGILLSGYLQMKQLAVTETLEQRIFANTAFEFATRIPRLAPEGLNDRYVPEMVNRFFDVVNVQKGISKLLIDFSSAIIQVTFGLIILTLYHPYFFFLALSLVVILYLVFRLTGPKGLETSLEESKYKYAVAHWLQEVGRNLMTFKLAGKTPLPLSKTDEHTSRYLHARIKHFMILLVQFRVLIFFKFLVAGSLIVLGSVLVINKQLNIGQFVAAEIIILLVMGSVEKLILNMATVYDVLTAIDKLNGVTEFRLERTDGTPIPEDPQPLAISLKNVSYQFKEKNHPSLSNITIDIPAGQHICISGGNGSGKTTLLRLLSGAFDSYEGNISYNGLPMRSLQLDSLREMIGENFSEHDIFKGSLRENITCGIEGFTDMDVLNAATRAGLKDFIESSGRGLDTELLPQGKRLPGSIRKQIILARCFIIKPKLYLIEDNMGHLNAAERQIFYNLIFGQCQAVTTVIVSNDPLIAQRCDKHYVLENGQLKQA